MRPEESIVSYNGEGRLAIFSNAAAAYDDDASIQGVAVGRGITVSAWRRAKVLDKVVLSSAADATVQLLNTFRTALIAVSDDIKVGRFGDNIQKLHACPLGDYLPLALHAGVTYTVTSVL